MRITLACVSSIIALATANPALAQDATAPTPAVTINGTAAVVSDYRFRGISQSDKNFAIQGSITVSHESGLYASVWGSSVDGYVTASGQANAELDLIVGFKKTFSGTTFDIGALYYVYPKTRLAGDNSSSDFIEPYLAVSHTFGPVTGKASIAYAPKQKALRLDQTTGRNRDNVYIAGDLSVGIPETPIGLTAHVGHTFGPSWLSIGNEYTDYGVGATVTYKMLTLGLSYVDADGAPFVTPSGRDAAKGGIVGSLTASF